MPGMMRSRVSGRLCPCCSQWRSSRTAEERDWRTVERSQLGPWERWIGDAREPVGPHRLEPDWLVFGYWESVRADDEFMNQQFGDLSKELSWTWKPPSI